MRFASFGLLLGGLGAQHAGLARLLMDLQGSVATWAQVSVAAQETFCTPQIPGIEHYRAESLFGGTLTCREDAAAASLGSSYVFNRGFLSAELLRH